MFLLVAPAQCSIAKQYVLFNHEITVSSGDGPFVYFEDQWWIEQICHIDGWGKKIETCVSGTLPFIHWIFEDPAGLT